MHHMHSYIPYGINDISFANMLDNITLYIQENTTLVLIFGYDVVL